MIIFNKICIQVGFSVSVDAKLLLFEGGGGGGCNKLNCHSSGPENEGNGNLGCDPNVYVGYWENVGPEKLLHTIEELLGFEGIALCEFESK